ncbi:MAG: triose-phosphate isomerase [Alphaproteobacteria bacterium]|nr:triose-phosphate isomerase [Alphaproteobacteria bacterium]
METRRRKLRFAPVLGTCGVSRASKTRRNALRPLIAGNWKMNGLSGAAAEVDRLLADFAGSTPDSLDILICPPTTLIAAFASRFENAGLLIGGQDCHPDAFGAHTGDISAEMLIDAGACFVIVGHSERRADHHESDALVRAKAMAALRAGLTPIVCVGESEAQRDAGQAEAVVAQQLKGSLPDTREGDEIVVAYEPVWAIGTGRTPTLADIDAMHASIRRHVGHGVRILYGGSVKPSNAREILARDNVNGALVGGASLTAADFADIIRAA